MSIKSYVENFTLSKMFGSVTVLNCSMMMH